jgi:hypothetical protein
MKRLAGFLMAAAMLLLVQVPAAHAQFNNLPNGGAWDQYLSNHPDVASTLAKNPSKIYDPAFRAKHQHLQEWLNKHPGDWSAMQKRAPWQNRYGAWDQNQWHDQDWWYHNNPQWAHEHHPEWWEQNKGWHQWQAQQHAAEPGQYHHHPPNYSDKPYDYPDHPHGHHHDHGHGYGQGNGQGHGHGQGQGHDGDHDND